jgi:hypothetical protein
MIICTKLCDGKRINRQCCITCDKQTICIYVCVSIKEISENKKKFPQCEYYKFRRFVK